MAVTLFSNYIIIIIIIMEVRGRFRYPTLPLSLVYDISTHIQYNGYAYKPVQRHVFPLFVVLVVRVLPDHAGDRGPSLARHEYHWPLHKAVHILTRHLAVIAIPRYGKTLHGSTLYPMSIFYYCIAPMAKPPNCFCCHYRSRPYSKKERGAMRYRSTHWET